MLFQQSDWTRIKAVLYSASEMPTAERESYLDKMCAGDEALREIVERLLVADQVDSPLDRSALQEFAGIIAEEDPNTLVGRRVGAYLVHRWITSGGSSDVYEVSRSNESHGERFALKLFRRDRNHTDLMRRFRIEQDTLTRLRFPNIARLHDTGKSDDGSPYLVMELVVGQRIDVYCARIDASINERLRLFKKVCAAVHIAHQHLVVHRDLKPSNVLVTEDGIPKLLDFGIAKLLQPPRPIDETITGVRAPMTPLYASPEQIRGDEVTTATDVYALGLLLYELLTGQAAQLRDEDDTATMEQIICHRDPKRPSERQSGSALNDRLQAGTNRTARMIDRDLDNIVLMALRKDPSRRYASVQQLADDIDRFMAALPVIARADTFVYRTSRFAKRHRLGVFTGAALAAGLIFGLMGTLWQARVAREQRDAQLVLRQAAEENLRRARLAEVQARQSAAEADQVSEFLVNLFNVADPVERRGDTITVQEVLDRGAETVTTELVSQPTVQASLLHTIGTVYYNMGLHHRAAMLLERAIDVRRGHAESEEGSGAASREKLGLVYAALDRLDDAERVLREACTLRDQSVEGEHVSQADAVNNLALILYYKGQYDEARPLYQRALSLYKSTKGQHEASESSVHSNLAFLEFECGRLDEAERHAEASLEIKRRLLKPGSPKLIPAMMSFAMLISRKGEFGRAESLMQEVTDLSHRVLGASHTLTLSCKNNLAEVIRSLGRLNETEEIHREVLAARIATFGPDHRLVATSMNNLASVLRDQGRYEEAVATYTNAMPIIRKTMAAHLPKVCLTLYGFMVSCLEIGDYKQAAFLLDEARDLLDSLDASDPAITSRIDACEGRLTMLTVDEAQGRRTLEQAQVTLSALLGQDHRDVRRLDLWVNGIAETVAADASH